MNLGTPKPGELQTLKRILVIDDEPTICELVADTLRDSGYIADTAPNGADALERMRRHVPQAIVLDLMMPRLNASGFVERMRLNPRFAAIPILIVTASYRGARTGRAPGCARLPDETLRARRTRRPGWPDARRAAAACGREPTRRADGAAAFARRRSLSHPACVSANGWHSARVVSQRLPSDLSRISRPGGWIGRFVAQRTRVALLGKECKHLGEGE